MPSPPDKPSPEWLRKQIEEARKCIEKWPAGIRKSATKPRRYNV